MIETFILAAAIAAPPPAEPQIRFFDTAVIEGETISLKQVADLRGLPARLRAHAELLVLHKWDRKRPVATLDHAELARRARALMPALAIWLKGPFDGGLRIMSDRRAERLPLADCSGSDDGLVKGDAVTVRIAAGAFLIEREAIALQPAKAGQRFFVKTADGNALAVQCSGTDK